MTRYSAFPQSAPRKRVGCFGCLLQVSLVLVLGAVLLTALTGVFFPWAFYLGGKFHIMPMWQGWGRAHAKGGDYLVWISFEPTPRSSGLYRTSNLTGDAYLCTPRGERLRLHLGGGMRKHLNLSTDGEPISLYMNYWPILTGQFINDRRPYLEFSGNWRNPNIVMDDHGSIGRAFEPDGTVYRGHGSSRPYMQEVIPITFVQGPRSEFDRACAAMKR
ncbi:MAG TPA: hypothetical protein VJ731_10120 [Terriglobales bacterium]|nr:hypothetical protein [Terriglobales bacterium]